MGVGYFVTDPRSGLKEIDAEVLWPGTSSKFGTLPTTLASCQYLEIILEESSCCPTAFGKMPKMVCTLPRVPHLTPPLVPIGHIPNFYDQNCPRKGRFCGFLPWPLTFDLDLQKVLLLATRPIKLANIKAVGQSVLPFKAVTATLTTLKKYIVSRARGAGSPINHQSSIKLQRDTVR